MPCLDAQPARARRGVRLVLLPLGSDRGIRARHVLRQVILAGERRPGDALHRIIRSLRRIARPVISEIETTVRDREQLHAFYRESALQSRSHGQREREFRHEAFHAQGKRGRSRDVQFATGGHRYRFACTGFSGEGGGEGLQSRFVHIAQVPPGIGHGVEVIVIRDKRKRGAPLSVRNVQMDIAADSGAASPYIEIADSVFIRGTGSRRLHILRLEAKSNGTGAVLSRACRAVFCLRTFGAAGKRPLRQQKERQQGDHISYVHVETVLRG